MKSLVCRHIKYFSRCFTIAMSLFPFSLFAGEGGIFISDAKVIMSDQKALILHNSNEEILVLGENLEADKFTGLIRFIPFPSEPIVNIASKEVFEKTNDLIKKHQLKYLYSTKSGNFLQDVNVKYQKTAAVRNIKVVKITSIKSFHQWLNQYSKNNKCSISKNNDLDGIVSDYIGRGFHWFVFDYIDVSTDSQMTTPIVYRFKSKTLYFPLKTSNIFKGIEDESNDWIVKKGIDLMIIAPCTAVNPNISGIPDKNKSLGPEMNFSSSSELFYNEINDIVAPSAFFPKNQKIFLQISNFCGNYHFTKDISYDFQQSVPKAVELKESSFFDDKSFYNNK